jgi:tRNA (guanine-N7-)-methyltransferase
VKQPEDMEQPEDKAQQQEQLRNRPIRSFVLRQGRLTDAQQRAIDVGMPVFGVAYAPQPLNLEALFGRAESPKILEIGFGMGETTARIAQSQLERDFLGIEVHTPGVGSLLKQIGELELTNLRIIQHDAVEVLNHMIKDASLDGVHIFFHDPWHKKRLHKRRLIHAGFV